LPSPDPIAQNELRDIIGNMKGIYIRCADADADEFAQSYDLRRRAKPGERKFSIDLDFTWIVGASKPTEHAVRQNELLLR